MKYITLSILLLSLSSCYKKKCGGNLPLLVVFNGFSQQEIIWSTLYKYTKGTNFSSLEDSNTHFFYSGKERINAIDFDYKIKINTQEIFISNLQKEEKSNKKFGLWKTKEMLVCPLDDNFLVQGTNAYQHGDTVFIYK